MGRWAVRAVGCREGQSSDVGDIPRAPLSILRGSAWPYPDSPGGKKSESNRNKQGFDGRTPWDVNPRCATSGLWDLRRVLSLPMKRVSHGLPHGFAERFR